MLLIVQMEILHLDSSHWVIYRTETELYSKQVFLWNPLFNKLSNESINLGIYTSCRDFLGNQTQEIAKNTFPELFRLKSFHFIGR